MAELAQVDGGKAAVYRREGTYYARIRVGDKYVHRTLKTGDLAEATRAAQKLVFEFEFSAKHGIPIGAKTFSDVIDEYVAFRQREVQHERTSPNMLR